MADTIGFIGLGNMGGPMARNLARAGLSVHTYDSRKEAVERLATAVGVTACSSVGEVTSTCGILVTMLPDNEHVRSVLADGEDAATRTLAAGSLVIDMSTVSPVVARDLHTRLDEAGIAFVDAPVSGGTIAAEKGTLTIMAGGEEHAFARAKPVLEKMGTTVVHAGRSGMGQIFKLCNQIIVVGNLTAIGEALSLCRAGGGNTGELLAALSGGAADSWMFRNLAPRMVAGDDGFGFPIDLQLKDLRLVGEAAHALDVPLPSTSLITALYLAARAQGGAREGNQTIYKVLARLANQVP
jgi:2-hydroxy-3-oxopropionate reductase